MIPEFRPEVADPIQSRQQLRQVVAEVRAGVSRNVVEYRSTRSARSARSRSAGARGPTWTYAWIRNVLPWITRRWVELSGEIFVVQIMSVTLQ
jgi:hypothetical protein